MKRNRSHYRYALMLMALMAFTIITLNSCKEDEEGMGTPVITAVRTCDPAKADSTFSKASAGAQIAVIGQNLSKVQKVFINDQQVYFNPTMNTDHSVIVTIPTEDDGFVLTAFDSSLKDEIRVETTHGIAVYSFKVTAPYPSISRLQATYPRMAGDSLYIHGLNLVDVEKIYFTDIEAGELDTTEWKTIGGNHVEVANFKEVTKNHYLNSRTNAYETTSVLGLQIPNLSFARGSLVVETAAGTTYYPYYQTPGKPIITSISSDMPVFGETLVIRGTEFVQVESVTYGDVTLPANYYTVAETEDEITMRFRRIPEVGCKELTITTPGGSVSVPFYNYDCLLVDFDEYGTNLGWDPKAEVTDECDSDIPPYTSSDYFASFNIGSVAQQWWGPMVYFIKDWAGENQHALFDLPGYDVIPANASLDNVYLACEVFNNNTRWDLNSADNRMNAYVRYHFTLGDGSSYDYDNFSWADYDNSVGQYNSPVLGDIDGNQPMQQWYRHVISFSELGLAGKTYADLKNAGLDEIRMQIINQSTIPMNVDFYIDNIRIYYKSK